MKSKSLAAAFFITLVIFMSVAQAQSAPALSDDPLTAFRKYKDITGLTVTVPTVVEIPFDEEVFSRLDFAVFDTTAGTFTPYFVKEESRSTPISIPATQSNASEKLKLIDNNFDTYAEFPVPENGGGKAEIVITAKEPITSSSLAILLDDHVALPNTIEIRTDETTIVAPRPLRETVVYFPKTTATIWRVIFTHGQPLRITELNLRQENSLVKSALAVRFLAQPKHDYRIYFDSDRSASVKTGEAGNLADDKDVMRLDALAARDNSSYAAADIDFDGVPDIADNCVSVPNADQVDENGNGRGDACDDFDRDGRRNFEDNCPNQPNGNQLDTDSDNIGDVCDDEESRITEKYSWLPWLGIGFAAIVIIALFALTVRRKE